MIQRQETQSQPIVVKDGIMLFQGKMSRNLLFEPMVSNAYWLEDEDNVIIFDPGCGQKIAKMLTSYILNGNQWKQAVIIAGHSHPDHACNFFIGDYFNNINTKRFVHEKGFVGGKLQNDPYDFIKKELKATIKYYNPFLMLFPPYRQLMLPLFVMGKFSVDMALRVMSRITSLSMPSAKNGSHQPEPLRKRDLVKIRLNEHINIDGWYTEDKIIIPTPGHSPCSISLLWPDRKAIFVSDADWLGNPVFLSGSIMDSISSLEKLKRITEAGLIDLLLPAHGHVINGKNHILNHLEFRIRFLKSIQNDVLSNYYPTAEKDILNFTNQLIHQSPLFRLLYKSNYPNNVMLVHNMVCICLLENGKIKQ